MNKKVLVDDKELSSLLNVCRTTLYHWRKKGLVPFFQMGRSIKYDPEEVLKAFRKIQTN